MSIPAPQVFADGFPLYAADLNAALSNIITAVNDGTTGCIFKDTDATYTGVLTFSQKPVLQAGLTLYGELRVAAGGLVVELGGMTILAGGLTAVGSSAVTGDLAVSGILSGGTISTPGTLTVGGVTTLMAAMNGTHGTFSGTVQAAFFAGNGASLTALPGSALTGTVASSLLTGALPAISGAALTGLNASALAIGTVDSARLATNLGSKQMTTLTFPDGGGGVAFVIDNDYLTAGSSSPVAMANAPFNGGEWRWIRTNVIAPGYSELCYSPIYVVTGL